MKCATWGCVKCRRKISDTGFYNNSASVLVNFTARIGKKALALSQSASLC